MTESETIDIRLSQSEALVLFDFLSRFTESDTLSIDDQAEQRVLWDVCADLERQLVQPLLPEYEDLLRRARLEVRDRDGA